MEKLNKLILGPEIDITLFQNEILRIQEGLQMLVEGWDVVSEKFKDDIIYPKSTFTNLIDKLNKIIPELTSENLESDVQNERDRQLFSLAKEGN